MKGLHFFRYLMLCVIIFPKGTSGKLGISRFHGDPDSRKDVEEMSVNEKIEKLKQLMDDRDRFVVPLTVREYRELIFATPRNHSAFVLFYNKNGRTCPECQEASDSFYQLAIAHYTGFGQNKGKDDLDSVFFAVVDMEQPRKVALNRTSPNLYYFPESVYEKYNPYSKMQVYVGDQHGFDVWTITLWIQDVSGIFINVRLASLTLQSSSTFGNIAWMLCWISIVLVFCLWRRGKWNTVYEAIGGGNYKYFIVLAVLWLISGQMYNHIRGTSIAYQNSDGGIVFISPSQRDQLLSESLIVMAMYAIMCYNLVKLIEVKETQMLENKPFTDVADDVKYSAFGFLTGLCGLFYIFKTKGQ